MSSLWKVFVTEKGKKWIDTEVLLIHPDAGDFPEDPAFALALLTSEAYEFDKEYNRVAASPLAAEIPFDDSYLPGSLGPIAHKFIEKVVVYEARNVPFIEEEAHEKVGQKVKDNLGIDEDHEDWDDEWEEEWINFWDDADNRPLAKYRIWVTDEQWIEHLKVGKHFDTASFSEVGPWIRENRLFVPEND
ncbi:hypothetical protein [Fluviicola sp.]|uniref:hypothetical protein n=1 Tax=Fluviicola sp. TaxID=1917219 RepID=UPI0031CE165D